MSDQQPYTKREIDNFITGIKRQLDRIETQTTATNGKVRKLIIVVAAVVGFVVATGLEEFIKVIPLLL